VFGELVQLSTTQAMKPRHGKTPGSGANSACASAADLAGDALSVLSEPCGGTPRADEACDRMERRETQATGAADRAHGAATGRGQKS